MEQTGKAERDAPFRLGQDEAEYLEVQGYNLGDLQLWADVISTPNAHGAAEILAARTATHGPYSVPLFVLSYLLRRSQVSARALRILIHATLERLHHPELIDEGGGMDERNRFILFVRLLRHARRVCPGAIPSLPTILIQPLLQGQDQSKVGPSGRFQRRIHMLNKAMRLIAVPSPTSIFKSNVYQEAALVRILRFMSEHNPPLQINREGYRAVILIQLAQKKTANEQQWAELKALSWPPWKEDRTAMDADITLEHHGISKAGETLQRMREAGYAHKEWERVASIYAGWDTDGTPTIQTMVNLGTAGERFRSGAALWIARITATRTAQEAWACFLACEDERLPRNQDVLLAVFRKLHKEEIRMRVSEKIKERLAFRKIYPGDSKEVEPLPPSTHLYTYTRTSPPTVEAFYHQLRASGVVFEGHCLAFLVSNATSLRQGFHYLLASAERYPIIRSILFLEDPGATDVSKLPAPLFVAVIELLARFSNVPISSALEERRRCSIGPNLPDGLRPNMDHALVQAIEILKMHRESFSSTFAWNAVLNALGNESSLENMHSIIATSDHKSAGPLTQEMRKWGGAIAAYWLARKVLGLMEERHLALDGAGFLALCQVVENAAVGSWMIMRDAREEREKRAGRLEPHVERAWEFARRASHARYLQREFRLLVGDADDGDVARTKRPVNDTDGDQRHTWTMELLEVPNPALLHAYIRALGWLANFQGLVNLVRWMAENRDALAERRSRDRNGEVMMRRAVVALRVFAERSWLAHASGRKVPGHVDDVGAHKGPDSIGEGMETSMASDLGRLEVPAPEDVVDDMMRVIGGVEDWGGWASEEEVEVYCRDGRFRLFLGV